MSGTIVEGPQRLSQTKQTAEGAGEQQRQRASVTESKEKKKFRVD